MTAGVVLLNFGEPETPDRAPVVEYLARIFFTNADLEGADTEAEQWERSRELAERRVPGLLAEYEAIGGSPLKPQSEAQAEALEVVLRDRGFDVETYVGMQFTDPTIEAAVSQAQADGVDHLVGLPVYPLCGPSTTVAALEALSDAVESAGLSAEVDELTGWHRHPTYTRIRADALADYAAAAGVDLHDDGTAVVFSAHGTPRYYLEQGSRYETYVEEYVRTQAAVLGLDDYHLGYQNHENRDIAWTQPDTESVVADLDAGRVVVDPVSFMHEQSETLSELDVELREEAEDAGLEFHRVPVPHDDDRFPGLLADLVEPFLAGFDPGYYQLRQCACRDAPGAMCLNAPRGE